MWNLESDRNVYQKMLINGNVLEVDGKVQNGIN